MRVFKVPFAALELTMLGEQHRFRVHKPRQSRLNAVERHSRMMKPGMHLVSCVFCFCAATTVHGSCMEVASPRNSLIPVLRISDFLHEQIPCS